MKPIIPKGWRQLCKGTIIKNGDKYWDLCEWSISNNQGHIVGDVLSYNTYIRRITPKEKP